MIERDADLIMWRMDRMSLIWDADRWYAYFCPHGCDTPKQSLSARSRGIIFYDRALRRSLYPFEDKSK